MTRQEHERGEHVGEAEWYASAGCMACYRVAGGDGPEYADWAGRTVEEEALPIDAVPASERLDVTGRYIESSLHGPDGWCGETRPHVHGLHGLSEGIIEYTDGAPAPISDEFRAAREYALTWPEQEESR